MTDRALRHLLTDITGNTHRAEFCIDKLYSPDSARGRLGLLELRGFEMPPHYQMAMVQSLLVRSLVAWFWDEPLRAPLIRHGANLHGRYLLPHFLIHDIADVAADLRAHGIDFDTSWLDPFTEFRFPRIGTAVFDGVEIELRGAIEPWNVLGEESTAGGTARYVDSSVERIQVRLIGADRQRYVVTCNGYPVPLLATDNPDVQVGGVRFRAWQPPSALHPTITVDGPLRFELVDTGHRHVPRRLHLPRVPPRRPVLRQPAGQRGGGRVAPRPPVRGHRVHPGHASTCPTSGRSRPANPPTWARRASWICAGCVPFCSDGTYPLRIAHDIDNLLAGYRAARAQQALFDPPRRRGHRIRRIRRRGRQCPAVVGRAGRMRRRARPRRARTAARRWCAASSTTTASPTSRSTRTATPSPTATAPPCRARGTSTRCRWWSRRPTGTPWNPVWCSAPGCSTRCWPTCTARAASVTGGVLPAQLLFAHPGYVRAARGIEVPGRHQLFMHACDISRAADGSVPRQRRLDAGPVGCGLRAGRPARRRPRHPRPLRADRARGPPRRGRRRCGWR